MYQNKTKIIIKKRKKKEKIQKGHDVYIVQKTAVELLTRAYTLCDDFVPQYHHRRQHDQYVENEIIYACVELDIWPFLRPTYIHIDTTRSSPNI